MFGDKKSTSNNASSGSSAFVANNIISGTKINGSVESEGDIRIDGELEGTLITKAKLVVGSTGRIEGDIDAVNAIIEGEIDGKVDVGELLYLKKSAVINGDISTRKLIVEEGAQFNGRCSMGSMKSIRNEESEGNKAAV